MSFCYAERLWVLPAIALYSCKASATHFLALATLPPIKKHR